MRHTRLAALLTAALAIVPAAQAQKKVLTQADWDKWKAINSPALSGDGKWAVYTLIPQVGDGELVVRATSGTTEFHVPRGYLGRANNVPGGLRGPAGGTGEADPTGPTATPAQITADSRFVVVSTQASQAEVEKAGRGRGAAATNRQSLAIVSLPDGKVTTIAGVRSFRLARANGTWLAYVPEPDSTTPGDSSARGAANAAGGGGGGRGRGGRGGGGGAPSNRRQFGSPLVLRNLATGAEERLTDVLAFAFDDSAKVLAYTVVSRDSTKDGAFLRGMSGGTTTTLARGPRRLQGADVRSHGNAARLPLGSRFVRPRDAGALHDVPGVHQGRRRAGDREPVAGDARDAHRRQRAARVHAKRHGHHVQRRAAADRLGAVGLARRQVRVRPVALQGPGAPADAAHQRAARSQQVLPGDLLRVEQEGRAARGRFDPDRERVGGRQDRRRQLARALHDRTDVGRRRLGCLRDRPGDERAAPDPGEDQRQRAALARRQVRDLLRQGALVHVQHGDEQARRPDRRNEERPLRQRDGRPSERSARVGSRRLDEG